MLSIAVMNMRSFQLYVLCSFLLGVYSQEHSSCSSENTTTQQLPALDPQDATSQALVYGYPLTQWMMIAAPLVFNLGINNFLHKRVLSTAEDTAVVRPNEDTLYSSLIYDLSHGDVIINLPEIPEGQFHLMTFYDPYGNIIASLGSGYLDEPGQYYIRKQPENAPAGIDTTESTYQAYVNAPTDYGVVLMRLVLNATNMDTLHKYQNETTSQNVSTTALPETPYLLEVMQKLKSQQSTTGSAPNTTETIMGLLAAFDPYDPPLYECQAPNVDNMLKVAGVLNGTYSTPAGVDLSAANATAESTILNCLSLPGYMTNFTGGWSMVSTEYMSPDFGDNYCVRAMVSRTAYLITRPPNTIYPVWNNETAGESVGSNGLAGTILNLGVGEAIIYDFVGGRPPLKNPGFWSLTMYSEQGYLVENSQETYRLGDRDNLTYSDGALVYPSFEKPTNEPDSKPFQILVQPADTAPPANWTSNWLPSPTGGENFTVWLRFYGTEDELVDGQYVYPVVTKTTAITNGTSTSTTSSLAQSYSNGAVNIGVGIQWVWVGIGMISMLLTFGV